MCKPFRIILVLPLLFCFSPCSYALTNGGFVSGIISTAGEIHRYTFNASAGESIQLSITGYIGMHIDLYYPDGTHFGPNSGVMIKSNLPQSGLYTVEVSAAISSETGAYELYYVKVPGANEKGLLNDSDMRSDTISDGDLDSYTFIANAGDSMQLSISGDIGMYIDLYFPDGSHFAGPNSSVIVKGSNSVTQSGTYTVVARSSIPHEVGNYDLYYVKAPGANEHGSLINGGVVSGNITPGDLDSYTFVANTGDSIQLSVSGDIGMYIYAYYPDGSLLAGPNSGVIMKGGNSITQSGTYTVVARSSTAHEAGNYQLAFNRTCSVPGDVAPVSGPDCEVNLADYLVMLRIILGLYTATPQQIQNGDLYPPGSGDSTINIQDLMLLQQIIFP